MNSPIPQIPHGEATYWKPYSTIVAIVAIVLLLYPLQTGSFGTIDFIQYWTAWRLMLQGKNPYDPNLLYEIQSAVTSGSSLLVYSWNPPWTYTLLAPILAAPFHLSATGWLLFQVAASLFIAARIPKALNVPSLGPVWGALALVGCLPILYSIQYGQLGILFALSITCFLLGVKTERFLLAGLSLLPLSAKPHLFALCAIPGLLWLTQIPRQSMTKFLGGAIGGFALLLFITFLVEPQSFNWWLEAMTTDLKPFPGMVPFQTWMTHTTVTGVRLLFIAILGINPSWTLVAIPLLTGVMTTIYFFWRRPRIQWHGILPQMLCLSLTTSSYGWVNDQACLAICQYLLITHAVSHMTLGIRCWFLLIVFSVQLVPLALVIASAWLFHWFAIVPWIYFALLMKIPKLTGAPIKIASKSES